MNYIELFNNTITALSFLANIILAYSLIKRYFTKKRYIKKVLGYDKEVVQVTNCTFDLTTSSGSVNNFVTYSSVIAMNNVITLFNIINQKFNLIESQTDAKNEINIGGFSANRRVNSYFVQYFPNFKFLELKSKQEAYEKTISICECSNLLRMVGQDLKQVIFFRDQK